jgi:hypothetical protein
VHWTGGAEVTIRFQQQQKSPKEERKAASQPKSTTRGWVRAPITEGNVIGNHAIQQRLKLSKAQEHEEVATTVDTLPGNLSAGQPLPGDVRRFFERRFGHDFSRVRIHSGRQAAASARSFSARAYTMGRDVVFGEGQYDPRSAPGRQLLAHELAHVVQQSRGGGAASFHPGSSLERAAESAAMNTGPQERSVQVEGASRTGIARAPLDPYRMPFWEDYEFRQFLFEEFGITQTSTPPSPDIAKNVRDAQRAGFMQGTQPGTADAAFQPHETARDVRQELDVAGSRRGWLEKAPSWDWVKKNWRNWRSQVFESAHMGPGRFLRYNQEIGNIQGYDYRKALTTLLPKNVHAKVDKIWVDWLNDLRKNNVGEVTVKDLREKMAEGIRSVKSGTGKGQLTPETKGTLEWQLHNELHINLGLDPNAKLKVPPPSKFNLRTAGAGALAAASGALEFYQLKESGHTTEESIAQALGGTLGGFASPGGRVGMGLGLGTAGLEALGAPKELTTAGRTVGDVLNFTGASLGQVFRADVNIKKAITTGDWKDFDRQTKEITEGKAGLPLEGYFRWVGIEADLASAVSQHGFKNFGEDVEHVFLKQTFSGTEKGLWYILSGDRALQEVKFVENLARGKGMKESAQDAQQQFHDSLADDVEKWAAKQATQFVKQDLPEAAEFAKKDIKGLLNKGKDQLARLLPKKEAKKDEPGKDSVKEAPAPPLPGVVEELKAEAKAKYDQAVQTVQHKYEEAKGLYQKGKGLLSKYSPF